MELSKETRITLIVVAGCVVLGLAAISVWSGAQVDVASVLDTVLTGLAGLMAGLGVAGGKP